MAAPLTDRPIFIVVLNHNKGPYIPEMDVADTDCVTVCKDLRDRQYTDVLAVIEINLATGTCREATDDFAPLIHPDPTAE